MPLPTTVTIHTSTYVKPEIHTADMRKVIMNHFLQKPLRQSGMVRNRRVMMGRHKTHSIRLRSLSGMANTLLCSDGTKDGKCVIFSAFTANGNPAMTKDVTFGDLIEAMQAEGQVRVARVVLEDPAVCSGSTVDSQAGAVTPAHQRLHLRLPTGLFGQASAAGAQLLQHKLADAQVEAQDNDVDTVDQQQAGGIVPVKRAMGQTHRSITQNLPRGFREIYTIAQETWWETWKLFAESSISALATGDIW